MRKIFAFLLSVVMMAGILAGCGSSGSSSVSGSQSNASADYSSLKIGVLLSGSANDGGWSQMAADAVKAVQEKYGCTVNYSESVPTTDYESTIRGYADAGYDIIVSHGAEFLDAEKAVAPDYPDIIFICTSAQSGQDPNLTGIDFATYQLGFLNGAACAMASKTKKIGAVASNQIDSLIAWAKGVNDGAKYIDSASEVTTVYTGSYDDALKAKQAVDALAQQGCDIITQNADACGVGAVEEAKELGLMDVGAVSDQTTLSDSCFISVLQNAQLGIEVAIDQAVQGTLKPGFVSMGAAEGVITLTNYSGTYANVLTDQQKATLQDLWQQAYDGVDLSTLVK